MTILIIANHVLGNTLGSGGDILLTELAQRWQKRGHHVHLLVAAAGEQSCARMIGSKNVTAIPGSWLDDPKRYCDRPLLVAVVYLLRSIRALHLIRRLEADVLYTPGDFWCDVLPAAVKKIQHHNLIWAAAIFHINESPLKRQGNSLPASLLSWLAQRASFVLIRRLANIVFPLNTGVQTALLKRGWPARRLYVQGAGLDVGTFTTISARSKRFSACYIGRINPTKGVFDLPKIWALVTQQMPDSSLILMGSGSPTWEAQLQQVIIDAGVAKNVRYLGFVPSPEAYRNVKESRLFISASTEEGFGMSIAEAMACGLPVVAYDLPVYREFFPHGMTPVPMGDTQAFAAAIIKLLTDTELYQAQRAAALAMVASYDWDHVAGAELTIMERAARRVRLAK